jgi:hypothetical protein
VTRPVRKGRVGGAAMMAWLFFANLFDPARVAVVERIADDPVRGTEASRRAATAAGRPE